jgi:MarR family transcriptional regulator for hemolysin
LLEYDFEESIGYWICMTSRALEQALNEELAPHGITFRQWQVLCWLALDGDLTQAQLADRMRIEAPTLVGILDRMERAAWISRQPSDLDRRKKFITPGSRAQPVWEKVVACARRVRARATEGISEKELAVAKKVMSHIQENLQSRNLVEGPVS